VPSDQVSHQVIIFGFNRPEMIARRLEELLEIAPQNVLISIDYKDDVMTQKMKSVIESYLVRWPEKSLIDYRIHNANQGLVSHITQTITDCLNQYECAVIIEDDISFSAGFYESALWYMKSNILRTRYSSFGGFSMFPKIGILENINIFRETPYFACWGWVIARENWIGYKTDLNNEEIQRTLAHSKTWNELSKKQQLTWLGRFNKAKFYPANTWDIQFQYHSFKIDKLNLVPVMRIVDNEGFSDIRGTHTQSPRPKILGKFNFISRRVNKTISPWWVSRIFVFIESIFFFEDVRVNTKAKKLLKRYLGVNA
jgi:hypothetical protein